MMSCLFSSFFCPFGQSRVGNLQRYPLRLPTTTPPFCLFMLMMASSAGQRDIDTRCPGREVFYSGIVVVKPDLTPFDARF